MKIFTKEEARGYSPAALAFYGDCAWESLVRRRLVENGSIPSGSLHKQSVALVNAGFQSHAVEVVQDMLTEEEADIMRRGRNLSGISVPRSSNPKDYHRATGFEALFGYLFLIGEYNRANELFEVIWNEKQNAE